MDGKTMASAGTNLLGQRPWQAMASDNPCLYQQQPRLSIDGLVTALAGDGLRTALPNEVHLLEEARLS